MAVATKTQYWNSRMNGTDPSALTGTFNDSWSGSGGSASGGYWVITNGTWTITPTTSAYTLFACLEYTTCLLYTSPSPRDATLSRMPSSA